MSDYQYLEKIVQIKEEIDEITKCDYTIKSLEEESNEKSLLSSIAEKAGETADLVKDATIDMSSTMKISKDQLKVETNRINLKIDKHRENIASLKNTYVHLVSDEERVNQVIVAIVTFRTMEGQQRAIKNFDFSKTRKFFADLFSLCCK